MKLQDTISEVPYMKIRGNTAIEVKGIAYDSRVVKEGYIFVCIKGLKTDGHNYASIAADKGAIAVIAENDVEIPEGITLISTSDSRTALALVSAAFFGYPTKSMKLIGVTGTNGKTTTTYMIKSILEKCGYKVSLIGTISNIIDNIEVEAERTTPESYDLQELFYNMKNVSTDYCVMEVSSHSLELKRVAGCVFNVGVFTNLTRDHLDFHVTFENYYQAKLKLFEQSETAVINADDQYGDRMINTVSIPVISYSEEKCSDVVAENVDITSKYTKFDLKYKGETVTVSIPLPGRFNVYNALAAASACISEGISLEKIKEGLEYIKGISGRSEVIDSGRGFTLVIDYAHTPDGLENILNTVREYAKGRIITLFGCGGDRDKTKRPIMGEVAAKLSDICIVTSDNPRTEEPMDIIKDIIPGVLKTSKDYIIIEDRREAIKKAIDTAKAEDVIVIAGKGHETYQILKDKTIHFDEREIVSEVLQQKLS